MWTYLDLCLASQEQDDVPAVTIVEADGFVQTIMFISRS